MNKSVTRKGSTPIMVWCLPEEKKEIESNAKAHGLSTSSFLRKVGLGLPVKSILDQQAVIELAKVNADMGRLGGLLKLWLSDDAKLNKYSEQQIEEIIWSALEEIRTLQHHLLEKVEKI